MLRLLILSSALGLTALQPPAADDPTPKSEPKIAPKAEPRPEERATFQVYRLRSAEPNDALQAFNGLLGPTMPVSRSSKSGPGGGIPRGSRSGPVDEMDLFATRSALAASSKGVTCRALADPRTRSLIVRGTEKDQQIVADLIAIIDTPEGKPLPELKMVKAFRLQHLDADDLVAMLQILDPTRAYRLAPLGRMKLLLATGTEEQMKELADAVKKIDVAADTK